VARRYPRRAVSQTRWLSRKRRSTLCTGRETAIPGREPRPGFRQAGTAATNLTRLVEHLQDGSGFEPRLKRYRYNSLGWAVSVGDGTVAQVGSKVIRGAPAHMLKTTIGSGYMSSVGAVSEAVQYALEG